MRSSHAWRSASCALALGLSASAPDRAATSTFIPRDVYERPGRLATLPDGRKLDIRCLGEGSPTVLLEAGFGAFSYAWGKVQARVSQVTRVCAYDRAGYGWSDPGPLPRDGEAIARDLDQGLKAARISGPFVVVGHSAGGLYARIFAARRRREVVGLVFVDSSVEHQVQRFEALFGQGVGSVVGSRRRPQHCLEVVSTEPSATTEPDRAACEAMGKPGAPGQGLKAQAWADQVSEIDTLFEQTSDQAERTRPLLKYVPAIVLTASLADGAPPEGEDPGAQAWRTFHHELAASFVKGDQRLVKSGHLMMNERPEVVAGAAIELVEAARKGKPPR